MRDPERPRSVALTEPDRRGLSLPCSAAKFLEIRAEAARGLVAESGSFSSSFATIAQRLGGRSGLSSHASRGARARWQWTSPARPRREREAAGEQLEEGDAEGVEIAARVDGAVHAPGLFGAM